MAPAEGRASLWTSGYLTRETRLRALRAGAHAVLPKDIDGEALAALLSSLCELRDCSPGASEPEHPVSRVVELLDLSRHEGLLLSELLGARAPLPACVLMERVWGRRSSRNLFDVTPRSLNRKLEGTGWAMRSFRSANGYVLARATAATDA